MDKIKWDKPEVEIVEDTENEVETVMSSKPDVKMSPKDEKMAKEFQKYCEGVMAKRKEQDTILKKRMDIRKAKYPWRFK